MARSRLTGVLLLCVHVSEGSRLRVLAKAVMKVKDERINKTNEVVNAIKLVKCNGWEEIFKSRVMETRRAELYQLAQYILFRSAMMVSRRGPSGSDQAVCACACRASGHEGRLARLCFSVAPSSRYPVVTTERERRP